MTTAWLNEHRSQGLQRDNVIVKFHVSFAFEDQIDLGEFFMVVRPTVNCYVDHVKSGNGVVIGNKCPPGLTAGTRHRRNGIELHDAISRIGCGVNCRSGQRWFIHARSRGMGKIFGH